MQSPENTDIKKSFIRWERLKNKYFIAGAIFLIWIAFFDQNNLLERRRNIKELKQLEHDITYYQQNIEETRSRLEELKTNTDNLEKFAREQYLMKKPDEDVFVIVEE